MRAIKKARAYGHIDPIKLFLVLSVTVPKKFKVPKFEKPNGSSNLKTYIIGHYREMIAIAHEDKLLIHFFHKSLTRAIPKRYI